MKKIIIFTLIALIFSCNKVLTMTVTNNTGEKIKNITIQHSESIFSPSQLEIINDGISNGQKSEEFTINNAVVKVVTLQTTSGFMLGDIELNVPDDSSTFEVTLEGDTYSVIAK